MMNGKQAKHRVPLVLIGLLGSQMILMSLQAKDPGTNQSVLRVWTLTAVTPFLSVVSSFASGIAHVWNNYADLRRVSEENQALKEEIGQLRMELHQHREAVRLAERLQQLVGFQQSLPGKKVAARVVGRDVAGWFQTVVIDKGRQEGIELNAVVVTPNGLVGRVIAVGPYSAQVQLMTDERSGAGGIIGVLGQSRALGVVEGTGEGLCKMRYVPRSEPVAEGDIVYTTGQDGIYPRHIPIGRVVSVEKGSAMVSNDITIEPLAQLGKLEEVVVLLGWSEATTLDNSVESGKE